jgi:hypothetical protein
MTGALARLAMALHLARFAAAAHNTAVRVSDWWLGVQCETANRLATPRQRERARMYGEVFALTGCHITGWPGRYLSEFVDGEEIAAALR